MRPSGALITLVAGAALVLSACTPQPSTKSNTAAYPTKPIEFVVPFAPGGATDLTARVLAQALSDELKVPVNVVNKPGAEQITAVDYVRKSSTDGYTLLADGAGSSSLQALTKNMPFKWDDRTFVGRLTTGAHAYAVSSKSQYNTLDDLVSALKSGNKKLSTSYTNGSTTSDLALLMLLKAAGRTLSDVTVVPYKSSGDVMKAIAAGDLDFGVGGASSTYSLASSGNLRVLAQTGTRPLTALPKVPATKDSGQPDLNLTFWVGISGPPKLNQNASDRLAKALADIAKDPAVQKKLDNVGVVSQPLSGAEFRSYVETEAQTFEALKAGAGQGK
jgi:tripartite-type tricarboxylate transporter receptor subunit TctC